MVLRVRMRDSLGWHTVNSSNRGEVTAEAAVRAARRVVGLYGDPTVAWSIVVRLTLQRPLDRATVQRRWEEMSLDHPGVGRSGTLLGWVADTEDGEALMTRFADEQYGDTDPLLRVALRSDGRVLLVAAHHGAMDGLGLLGAAGRLAGLVLESSARGVASDADHTSFWLASLRRLGEALVRPPQRLHAPRARRGNGDHLASRELVDVRVGSAALLLAAARAVRSWNATAPRRTRRGRLVVAMGLSRRPGRPMAPPDRDTAYARLDAHRLDSLAGSRQLLASTSPEPAFPQTEGLGIGPLVTRALASRLGSTLLVSNLGLVDQPGLAALEFWPVPTGPAGVALGLASTPTTSTVTVRTRRPWFGTEETDRLADLVARQLTAAAEAQ